MSSIRPIDACERSKILVKQLRESLAWDYFTSDLEIPQGYLESQPGNGCLANFYPFLSTQTADGLSIQRSGPLLLADVKGIASEIETSGELWEERDNQSFIQIIIISKLYYPRIPFPVRSGWIENTTNLFKMGQTLCAEEQLPGQSEYVCVQTIRFILKGKPNHTGLFVKMPLCQTLVDT
nr:unnamed protein product [Fasciola hepatica]